MYGYDRCRWPDILKALLLNLDLELTMMVTDIVLAIVSQNESVIALI